MECDNPQVSPVQENSSNIPSKGDDSLSQISEMDIPSGVEITWDEGKSKGNEETKEKMLNKPDDTEPPVTSEITHDDDKKLVEDKELGGAEDKQTLSKTNYKQLAVIRNKTQDDNGEELDETEDKVLNDTNDKKQAMTNGNKHDESRELHGDDELEADVNTQDVTPLKTSNKTQEKVTEQSEHDVEICLTPHLGSELQLDESDVDSIAEENSVSGDIIISKNENESLVASPLVRSSTVNPSVDGVNPDNAEEVTRAVDSEIAVQTMSNEDHATNSVTMETGTLKQIGSEENEGSESGNQEKPSNPDVSDKSGQTGQKVTFSSQGMKVAEFRLSEGALRLKQELEDMRLEEERQNMLEKEKKKAEVAKLKAKLAKARTKRNVSLDMNTDLYKKFISNELVKEEVIALTDERERQNQQTRQMARDIDKKHGISERRKAGSMNKIIRRLEAEAKQQARNDEITRELTREEIQDLHIAFDMFDTKRRGLITISDLKRLLKMLKFGVSKGVLKDSISNLDKTKRGIVDFNDFLQLVVIGQGDGPDPFEEIVQGFNLIDTEDKGYITFEDLRAAADVTNAMFSNTMLREMMEEADVTGDGRVSRREFISIMLDTNRYRAIKRAMLS
ncbi:serine/threonine-protein kinase dst2-like [Liolophura sinensis]|uniref:serine/threonine-protein kinase dst2-like n=1 Tax=Liolophura sinensis TaxID=3198878 RepID=UPI003158DE50